MLKGQLMQKVGSTVQESAYPRLVHRGWYRFEVAERKRFRSIRSSVMRQIRLLGKQLLPPC